MSGKISLSSLLDLFEVIETVASTAAEHGRLLRGIIELARSEAAVNPEFAAKLEALMQSQPKTKTAVRKAVAKKEAAEKKAVEKAAAKKEAAEKKAAEKEAAKKEAAEKKAAEKEAAKKEAAERKEAAKRDAAAKAAAKKAATEKTTVPKAAPEKVFGPPDVYEELKARGDDGLRIWLIDQPMEILKAIIKQERFDPSRRTLRWTDQQKFADYIVQALRAKMSRGSAFIGTTPDIVEPSTG